MRKRRSRPRGRSETCPNCDAPLLWLLPLQGITVFQLILFGTWTLGGMFIHPAVPAGFGAFLLLWFWFRGPQLGWSGWAGCPDCRWFLFRDREDPEMGARRRTGYRIFRRIPIACLVPAFFYFCVALFSQAQERIRVAAWVLGALSVTAFLTWMGSWVYRPDPRSEE